MLGSNGCGQKRIQDMNPYTGIFYEEWNKSTPQIHIRKFEEETSALLGVIFDIHRDCTNPENPMNIRNDFQQGTLSQAVCSSNFLM